MDEPDVPLIAVDDAVRAARTHWRFDGSARPDFAEDTAAGEESVWDYPRPPRAESVDALVEVYAAGHLLASSRRAVRVLETAGAPTVYLPPEDVAEDLLIFSGGGSVCEWKGVAQSIHCAPASGGERDVGWRYVRMFAEFAALYRWCAFYAARVECLVDGVRAAPQPGGYYGGWVLPGLKGPIKGAPGSAPWW
ncbi:MAG: DUF427 domain-containing protein [Pseudomonadota bacterium]